jgi:hypothetical protein
MCNSLQRHYTLCGHVLTEASSLYWELCRNALTTDKRCTFAIFSEERHREDGKCPTCLAASAKEVDEPKVKARVEGKGRLRRRDGNKGMSGRGIKVKGTRNEEGGGIENFR